ncbi:hypothetical protein [Streptomyces sp. Ag109_G2-15]|uniref:hypothetical protein n=1 Tax=Streptomyces sp. Ag109_G2-15 TaxID=1938850 RepID=UPI00359C5006
MLLGEVRRHVPGARRARQTAGVPRRRRGRARRLRGPPGRRHPRPPPGPRPHHGGDRVSPVNLLFNGPKAQKLLAEKEISDSRRVRGLGIQQRERLLERFTPKG